MKILYFTNYSEMYGANKSLLELSVKLKNKYYIEPIIITPKRGALNIELDKYSIENHIIFFFPWSSSTNNKFKYLVKKIGRIIYNKFAVDKILNIIKTKDINLVHTNSSVIDIGLIVSKQLNIPHIWHIREFGKEDYSLKFFDNITKSIKTINNSNKIIIISECLYQKYIELGIHSNKVSVIYNGVEAGNYFKRNIPKKNKNLLKIIFSGLIIPNKNQMELVKAIDYLVNIRNRPNVEVLIVGGSGDFKYFNSLKEYISEHSLSSKIVLKGYVSNISDIIKTCNVGVVSSLNEAFGRVTVEYMMAGLPVIASNSGANPEIVNDGVNGLIYNLNDYIDLSNKIEKLYDNPQLFKTLAENAQKKAMESLTSDINAQNISNVYKEVLGEVI